MRIAYVTETWPPEVNGVALTASRTVDFLRRRHTVQVVRPRQKESTDEAHTLLVRSMPIPMYRDLRMGLPSGCRLQKQWNDAPPDLVHIATEGPLGWSALCVAQRLGIPTTTDFRTRFDQYASHYAWSGCAALIRAYLRSFHNRSARTFVPTEEMRHELQSEGFQRLLVAGRGVDTKRFHPACRSLGLRRAWTGVGPRNLGAERAPVALYVGRLAAEKNLALVIRAWQAMRKAAPLTQLVMVGDGPMRAGLERRYPQIIFAGVRRDNELAMHYASADIFLFPSLTETFGNVTLEAMASGLALTAYMTAAAGMYISDGVNGCAVLPGDEEAFVAAAVSLVQDRGWCRSLGTAARATAEEVSWDRVLTHFENALVQAAVAGQSDERACLA